MIRHHLSPHEEKASTTFHLDEKKLVKTFLYQPQNIWLQYFTGFLFMEPDVEGKIDLKIRLPRPPQAEEIKVGMGLPFDLATDQQGLYTVISENMVRTVEKPEQNLLYLKLGKEGRIIAISFYHKSYCQALYEHLNLVLQNTDSSDMTWTQQNLPYLNESIKENLIYIDTIFFVEERVQQFCNFFNKTDKQLYKQSFKNTNSSEEKQMIQFFEIIKNMFLRGSGDIIRMFIGGDYQFETVLKCLSYNPFGDRHINYLQLYRETIKINNPLGLNHPQLNQKYRLMTKVRFLRDIAICMFIQIPVQTVFNEILNESNTKIIELLTEDNKNILQRLQLIAKENQYTFFIIFTEIWEAFKALWSEDTKTNFYDKWQRNDFFSVTISGLYRLAQKDKIQHYSQNFWQRVLQSLNPMLSFYWDQSQKHILTHKQLYKSQDGSDYLSSLVMVGAGDDPTKKSVVLQHVRYLIETTYSRAQMSKKWLAYVFDYFIWKVFPFYINESCLQEFLDFLKKIYTAQPIRTRQFIIGSHLIQKIEPFFRFKHILIPFLQLIQIFIKEKDENLTLFFGMNDVFAALSSVYVENKFRNNILGSLFASISAYVKQAQLEGYHNISKQATKMFNSPGIFKQTISDKQKINHQQPEDNPFKRNSPESQMVSEGELRGQDWFEK